MESEGRVGKTGWRGGREGLDRGEGGWDWMEGRDEGLDGREREGERDCDGREKHSTIRTTAATDVPQHTFYLQCSITVSNSFSVVRHTIVSLCVCVHGEGGEEEVYKGHRHNY